MAMSVLPSTLRRGLLAGAAGTAVLNAVTYLDMAVRGRDASSAPEDSVRALADRAGREIPGDRKQRGNRVTALGALLGTASGLGAGIAAAAARSAGFRLPYALDAAVIGAGAMVATDGPMVALGLTDLREWSTTDWISDAVPHLAYGAATSATLRAMDELPTPPPARAGAGLVSRAALLGLAGGCRSSVAPAAVTLTSSEAGAAAKVTAVLAVGGELAADKRAATPARTAPQGFAARLAGAAGSAATLSRRDGANPALPVVVALIAATGSTFGGLAWRQWASARMPDWQAAVLEDAVALGLAALAAR